MNLSIKRMLFAMPALMMAVVALGQQPAIVNGSGDDGREETLHKVVYYKITESENYEHSHSVVLREVAEFMQRCPDATVTVVGYADRGTGTARQNVTYAMNRATKFKEDLITRYAIDANRIITDSKGDREQPFAENDLNRCVIVDGRGHQRAMVQQPTPPSAHEIAAAQRDAAQAEKYRHYQMEMNRRAAEQGRDTIVVVHKDTVWVMEPVDTLLKPERPFGLNKAHRWRNWFVQLAGGPAIFQGDHNADADMSDRIYPAFDLSIGKWIYPALGLRAGVNLDVLHSYYNANANRPNPLASEYGEFVHGASPNEPYKGWLYKMEYNTWNFHVDAMINFSSLMWRPYNRRFWNLIGYAGVGCIATWDNGHHDWFNYATSWNVGILNSFRLNEHLDINIDLRLKKFDDDFNCWRQGHGMDGITDLMVGLTWHFTERGF